MGVVFYLGYTTIPVLLSVFSQLKNQQTLINDFET